LGGEDVHGKTAKKRERKRGKETEICAVSARKTKCLKRFSLSGLTGKNQGMAQCSIKKRRGKISRRRSSKEKRGGKLVAREI